MIRHSRLHKPRMRKEIQNYRNETSSTTAGSDKKTWKHK